MKVSVKIVQFEEEFFLVPNSKQEELISMLENYLSFPAYAEEREDILAEIEWEFGKYKLEDLNEVQLFKEK